MAYDLYSMLQKQGLGGDYGALYPAPASYLRPDLTTPSGAQVPVPQPDAPARQPTPYTPQGLTQQSNGIPAQPPGFMEQFRGRGDRSAIDDGLIAAGANLLAGKDFKDGLSTAVMGFNDAYDARKDKTKAESTPKVLPLADGAFSMLIFPDGTQKVVPNGEVQNYINGQKDAQNAAMVGKIILQENLQAGREQAKDDRKTAKETQNQVNDLGATIQQFEDARGAIERHGRLDQVASYLPKGVVGMFSPETAVDNMRITQLSVQKVLEAGNALKGATSDRDMQFLRQSAPDAGSSRAELMDWHTRALQAMRNIEAKLVAQNNAAGGGATAAATPTATPSSYTGAASKPAKVSSADQSILDKYQ